MANINLSSAELESYSSQISSINQQMQETFMQIQQKMNEVSGIWNSPASQSYMNQFHTLLPVFSDYAQILEQYSAYLMQTAASYQENEMLLSQMFAS